MYPNGKESITTVQGPLYCTKDRFFQTQREGDVSKRDRPLLTVTVFRLLVIG